MSQISRREILDLAAVLAGGSLLAADAWSAEQRIAAARNLPVDDPQFALRTWARLVGDPGGRVMWNCLSGMVFGFLPQGDDVKLSDFARRLYRYRACTARRVRLQSDGSVEIRMRSWNYYANAETGELHRELLNPYTGKRVPCPPRASPVFEQIMTINGPTSAPAFPSETSNAGRPMKLDYAVMGDNVWIRQDQFARFHPPDTTWFKLEADMLTYVARLDDVLDGKSSHIPNTTAHNLVAEWQTWMNMHGSPGHILFVGNGCYVPHPGKIPPGIQTDIDREFPGTLREPLGWS